MSEAQPKYGDQWCAYCRLPILSFDRVYTDGALQHHAPDVCIARLRAIIVNLESATKMPVQADVLHWAVESFGPIARNRDERAARLAEEAIEVAQAEGVELEVIVRIAERVYSRPAGDLHRELGGVALTALSMSQIAGLSFASCGKQEWLRVKSKPRDWWQKKHAEKVAAGTADLSPPNTFNSRGAP
ncbi:MAG TPA: hypothetical protein VFS24_06290 [Steroidobacteraceae bacterium]|nr:hypothetical protein [Steroidobacteraceae bacterium]